MNDGGTQTKHTMKVKIEKVKKMKEAPPPPKTRQL